MLHVAGFKAAESPLASRVEADGSFKTVLAKGLSKTVRSSAMEILTKLRIFLDVPMRRIGSRGQLLTEETLQGRAAAGDLAPSLAAGAAHHRRSDFQSHVDFVWR